MPLPADETKRDFLLEAGAFSQQMAVPWQADFFECSATKFPFGDPPSQRRIAWWPAQRPDDVFRQNDPATRIDWARDENGLFKTDLDMVEKWSRLGFIVDVGGDLVEIGGPPVAAAVIAGGDKPLDSTGGVVVAGNGGQPPQGTG